jgi:hypothetical protein
MFLSLDCCLANCLSESSILFRYRGMVSSYHKYSLILPHVRCVSTGTLCETLEAKNLDAIKSVSNILPHTLRLKTDSNLGKEVPRWLSSLAQEKSLVQKIQLRVQVSVRLVLMASELVPLALKRRGEESEA